MQTQNLHGRGLTVLGSALVYLIKSTRRNGGVVQLAVTCASGAQCCRFESYHRFFGNVTQMVECNPHKVDVVDSIATIATSINNGRITQWFRVLVS